MMNLASRPKRRSPANRRRRVTVSLRVETLEQRTLLAVPVLAIGPSPQPAADHGVIHGLLSRDGLPGRRASHRGRAPMARSHRHHALAPPPVEIRHRTKSSRSGQTPSSPSDPTTAFLFTPVPDTVPLAMHIHPHLTILINGQPQVIPANTGFIQGFLPIHTHDSSGTLHVESPEVHTFRLKDFFAIWQRTFNDPNIVFTSQDILGHQVDATHQITMTVNGQPSTAFENQVLNNPDGTLFSNGGIDIVISFGPR